jgi:hypothetical protein
MTTAMTQTSMPILEALNREDPQGRLRPFVNMLARQDQVLMYLDWTPCNANLTYKGTRVSSVPTPTDISYHMGVAPAYGTTEPYEEPITMMAGMIVMDLNMVSDRGSGKVAFVNAEMGLHFEGTREGFGDRMYYGDRGTNPLRLRGFCYRAAYNTTSSAYVYDNSGGNASATVNKTSAWVIRTGDRKFQMTYPEHDAGGPVPEGGAFVGSAMGFKQIDFGLTTASDGTNEYPAFKMWYQWRFGMVVHDPRAIARICNISCTNIDSVDDFGFNHLYVIDVLGSFLEYFGDLQNTIIVVPTIVHTQIAKEIDQKSNVYGTIDDPFGRPISTFSYDGVKVPICTSNSIKGPHSTAMEAKVS